MLDERKEEAFCTILREELQLATGCTEPIAVAYCAARLRQVLGQRPCRILAEVSGNILKNVKSVVVPNTGGRRGLPAAIAVGISCGIGVLFGFLPARRAARLNPIEALRYD